jgi:DNA invertase Pin-like site-specific DNA recombinase
MIERHPVGYIRRSTTSRGNPGDASREFQTAEVRKLAGTDRLLIVDGDWGRSAATDKTAKRLAFLEVLGSIERGEVSTLYAYSCDRLARSVQWAARLLDACERAGTTITTGEGTFAPGDDGARLTFQVFAVMNENAVRAMTRKAHATFGVRTKRGDVLGRAPYGTRHEKVDGRIVTVPDPTKPVGTLVDAYNEAGSVFGAVRLLNEAHVPAPRGGSWHATPLRHILERAGVALPKPGPTGIRVPGRGSVLAQLVKCHCGHVMTPNNARDWLYCSKGQVNPKDHGRYYVNQRTILPAIHEEADLLSIPFDGVEMGERTEQERETLIERRRRLALAFADGALDEPTYREQLAAANATAERLDAAIDIVEMVHLDWTAPTPIVNRALRALFEYVWLAPDMTIAEVKWRVPAWRRATAHQRIARARLA